MNTYIGFMVGSVFLGVMQVGFNPPTKAAESEYKQELRKMLIVCKEADCQSIQHLINKSK